VHTGEVYFRLGGDQFEPDDVTARLRLEPSRVSRRAEPRPEDCAWILSAGKFSSESVDVYDLSSQLTQRLEPHASEISELIQECSLYAVLQVVLHLSLDPELPMPAIGFDQQTIAFLAKIGASVDVDTYRQEG
jgi:hypothetical protein